MSAVDGFFQQKGGIASHGYAVFSMGLFSCALLHPFHFRACMSCGQIRPKAGERMGYQVKGLLI